MKEFGDGFDGVTFSTLIDIVAETAIVSFYTLPVGVLTSSDESSGHTMVLSFSDSRILSLYNFSKMSSCGICVIDHKIPSHFESNS